MRGEKNPFKKTEDEGRENIKREVRRRKHEWHRQWRGAERKGGQSRALCRGRKLRVLENSHRIGAAAGVWLLRAAGDGAGLHGTRMHTDLFLYPTTPAGLLSLTYHPFPRPNSISFPPQLVLFSPISSPTNPSLPSSFYPSHYSLFHYPFTSTIPSPVSPPLPSLLYALSSPLPQTCP